MKALLLPLDEISLRIIHSPSTKSKSFSRKKLAVSILSDLKTASTTHFCAPAFIARTSARSPNSKFIAPKRMLFPAPVSPVITEKPG